MNNDINVYLHNMIGSEVSTCRVMFGGVLKLNLNKNQENGLNTKWSIMTRECSWRIIKQDYFVCCSDDEIEDIESALKSLIIGKISEIIQNTNLDFSLLSENGIRIDFRMNSVWSPLLTVYNHECAFKLTDRGWVETNKDELKAMYDETYSFIDIYAKECAERWRDKVYLSQDNNICDNCFYFRSFGGSFYYWQYGVCSCKNSEYDGKLVSVKSGCICHTKLKDLT